jgi:hypothetical protein
MASTTRHIEAVVVNHNTSKYTELALRSLYAHHSPELDVAVTVMDNESEDTDALQDYCRTQSIPFIQSGLPARSSVNTHGEVLRSFILSHPDTDYYLLMDADICFVRDNTIESLREDLAGNPGMFAVQARMSIDGANEIQDGGFHIGAGTNLYLKVYTSNKEITDEEFRQLESTAHSRVRSPHGIYRPRCHPACTLIRNTDAFRLVAEHIGLSSGWVDGKNAWGGTGFYDTFGLTCQAMKTHRQDYMLASSAMVVHFFGVSYETGDLGSKHKTCEERLSALRSMEPQATATE